MIFLYMGRISGISHKTALIQLMRKEMKMRKEMNGIPGDSGKKREYAQENKGWKECGADSCKQDILQRDDFDKIEGRNPVLEALRSGRSINKILVARGDREGSVKQIMAMAREKGVVVQEVDRAKLDSISSIRAHQGVIAYASVKDYVSLEDILKTAESRSEPAFIIILDEITDVYNLGSILRTADAVGAHGVVIPKRHSVGLCGAVAKTSAGAIEYVPVARVANIAQTIEYLKKKNIWVVGADSTGDMPFYRSDLKGPIALVIGSEGEGIRRLVRERCDFVVNIPMQGSISSLNAAVAGAIIMYEILRQRRKQSE